MTELISSGLELMLAGMGIVFLFLTMLVIVINAMSKLITRYLPEEPLPHATAPVIVSAEASKSYIAAITAAIHEYRRTHE